MGKILHLNVSKGVKSHIEKGFLHGVIQCLRHSSVNWDVADQKTYDEKKEYNEFITILGTIVSKEFFEHVGPIFEEFEGTWGVYVVKRAITPYRERERTVFGVTDTNFSGGTAIILLSQKTLLGGANKHEYARAAMVGYHEAGEALKRGKLRHCPAGTMCVFQKGTNLHELDKLAKYFLSHDEDFPVCERHARL